MSFNIKQIPFSCYGSYLSISYLPGNREMEEGIYLRNIRGGDDHNGAVFKLDVIENGEIISFTSKLDPSCLTLETERGFVKLIFPENDCLRIFGKNVGLRLSLVTKAYDNGFWYREKSWQINAFSKKIRFMLTPLKGGLEVDAPWVVNGCTHVVADFMPDPNSNSIEGTIEEFLTVYPPHDTSLSFEEEHKRVHTRFSKWHKNTLQVPEEYNNGRKLAAYITWSSVVKQEGMLTRPAMYMSKNWMTNIWSWDHCFNAMALTKNNPDLAWDQLMIFFDVQDENGMLPDYMNDQFAYWNCSKPPIHGWALSWMLKHTDQFSREKLNEIYVPLSKWTRWYINHRKSYHGFPEYQHGNDSGWDNSTVFHKGIPVESPDLCAFLILQMQTLGYIAQELDLQEEKQNWKEAAEDWLEKMIAYFWNGERFVAKYSGEEIDTGDSLLLFMPIVLGDRLPEDVRKKLIDGLKEKGRFLTEHGLATESTRSPYYLDDGYWRGPIWAPTTMLLVDGLVAAGEKAFARELALKYCDMAEKNGMAENFNAVTGEGLRDRAFTWTSSVFLILGSEYSGEKI
ncbi:amylo-alpha-1,6-glucosidase [Virgibacillus necropolis]|uniref:Mannosylglycerate hydrolase MGH1-like glycoside hydrolase domain-containing protein n=1 Tax=Virgibacillus necropolis TaxID=163877 RepID=A0A221MF65_9BACI|nr:trehalase family glycosidase [Virgibacillus necropolis]ASN06285.1 hypothetical protein CFK40_15290 [Virgibacillus necropolis]